MYRGGTGMANRSSLSCASKSCDLAIKTLPMNMSTKDISA